MALIKDEFRRCPECNCKWLVPELQQAFHANTKERENEALPLTPIETRIVYRCSQCGHTIQL